MAKIEFPRGIIEKEIKLNAKIIEKINMFGIPVESLSEEKIELEISANRPDLLSIYGFLRAFKSFLGKETGLKKYKIDTKLKNEYVIKVNKNIKEVRPYTACAVVKGLTLNNQNIEEIINLQEKLHATIGRQRKKCAIGIYPMDKIKFPINYEARKPEDINFIPLGSDKELNALQILQKHPAGKEYAELLQGYDNFPVFVDEKGKILSMPPIINSEETGRVTTSTKDVFIECSGWHKETLGIVLNIIVTTLADMGGKIYAITIKDEQELISPDLSPKKIKIQKENIEKLLGIELKDRDIEKLAAKMGHEYKNNYVLVPPWRADILHEVDIAEDIAIAYGYENFIPQLPNVDTIGEESKNKIINSRITELLIGLGFIETSSFHFVTEEEARKIKIDKPILIENSKTEYKILRQSLLIPILRTLSNNTNAEYPQKLCEIGAVFMHDDEHESGIKENNQLVIALTPENFTEAKQTLDYLLRMLKINYKLEEATKKGFVEGRTAEIIINNQRIGYFGEAHPNMLADWHLKMPLAIIELNLEEIYKILQ